MLARRLSIMRRTTVLTPVEPLPVFTPTYIPIGPIAARGFITVSKIDGSASFSQSVGENGRSYPYLSADELGWTYIYTYRPTPTSLPVTVDRHYRQSPNALAHPPLAADIHSSVSKVAGTASTPLRDCVLGYDNNATSISRKDWSGAVLPSISLTGIGMTTGTSGLCTSSGRHAVSFSSGNGPGHLEIAHQTAGRWANPSINPGLGLRQNVFFHINSAAYDFPASNDFDFGFTVSSAGSLKKLHFNSDLFPLVVPSGAGGVPVWKCSRKVEELDRCQGVDAVYILARLFAQEIRSDGVHQQVFWGSKYLRRIRASYSARHMVAILKVVDDQVAIHRVLIDGASTFPFGDYSYHQTARSTYSYFRGIEFTRATISEGLIENTGIAITESPAYQISAAEYLQHFDHISEPGDPEKPWILGYPINVIDRIPLISTLFFEHFNSGSFNDDSRASNTLKMTFDGRYFYIVRGLPVYFDGPQPIYKISNTSDEVTIFQDAKFSNNWIIRRLQALPSVSILYVDASPQANNAPEFSQWQVDLETGARISITDPTANHRSLSRAIPDFSGSVRLLDVSIPAA